LYFYHSFSSFNYCPLPRWVNMQERWVNITGIYNKSSLEGRQADFIQAIAGIFWILVLTISSLPIYFNLKSIVRQKRILSFISFFFLPILVTIIFWLTGDKDAEWLSFYIATSYFLSAQFISYLLFIRRNKSLLRTISN